MKTTLLVTATLLLAATHASAQTPATVVVEPAAGTGTAGQPYTVTITVRDSTGAGAAKVHR